MTVFVHYSIYAILHSQGKVFLFLWPLSQQFVLVVHEWRKHFIWRISSSFSIAPKNILNTPILFNHIHAQHGGRKLANNLPFVLFINIQPYFPYNFIALWHKSGFCDSFVVLLALHVVGWDSVFIQDLSDIILFGNK